MHRGRSARFNRLIRRTATGDGAAVEHRRRVAAHAAIGAAVRWSLARHGIDPALAPALRVADEAAAELAASDDPSPEPLAIVDEIGTSHELAASQTLPRLREREGRRYRASAQPIHTSDGPTGGCGPPTGLGIDFDNGIARLVERYRSAGGPPPDLAQASLAELLAWCIAAADRPESA
ncbi:MAG: hypothetical protein AB7T18_17785 [Alphaproteobacteria bacterium]